MFALLITFKSQRKWDVYFYLKRFMIWNIILHFLINYAITFDIERSVDHEAISLLILVRCISKNMLLACNHGSYFNFITKSILIISKSHWICIPLTNCVSSYNMISSKFGIKINFEIFYRKFNKNSMFL